MSFTTFLDKSQGPYSSKVGGPDPLFPPCVSAVEQREYKLGDNQAFRHIIPSYLMQGRLFDKLFEQKKDMSRNIHYSNVTGAYAQ